ncbi:ribose 5-phosphate isomerase [Methanococcus vannielii SB]|jgi:ribose 5-phosphate isomerase A|uniref:Ribose-5-phosphate isomerase A n=1 Tax=Methanococcus vannielii (strain ATCC 35089 / DSM 1224 / JCM 13029 / OCM 148 / SB) TaxID=406327 RepID=RPIA_METVS|nr:ribose-5-phosphate isomerase RpiA [Methanococcus vannielii]A6UPJ0.1 RecName: Full=Ribose-5-phosphate isomerase A; AltName: Full=Phosphoriboisomerase A; Short=PRI [Methanococcus vannielii SB]ABR54412.1 ribose 5-phosphate isomerase [Methanococcus vannielii SB]
MAKPKKSDEEVSIDSDSLKIKVAKEAAKLIKDEMVVGLGSGSTANLFIQELGKRVIEEELYIYGVPTSFDSRMMANQSGIPLISLDQCGEIDIAIDGADEIDKKTFSLIKGGGGCHTMEKIVDYYAKEFVVLADESKMVDSLGENTPVPLEVIPFSYSTVLSKLLKINAAPAIRSGSGKMGPVITDNGNMIIDVFINIEDAEETETMLNSIPGVLENGIFTKCDKVLIGTSKKVEVLKK